MTSRHAWVFLLIGALLCGGWINYDDKVERSEPQYGKEFIGFYLKVFTDNVEFEQETPEPITVVLKNTNPRSTLMPDGGNAAERRYALYIVVADKDGATSLFSRNLLEKDGGIVTAGKVPPQAETELLKVPFDSLEVAKVEAFEDGLPKFEPDQRMARAGQLGPQIFTMKAILISVVPGKRPDFTLASSVWRILLQPKSAARMSDTEKQTKMQAWLKKMGEGAYGGIGVSTQLAALGDAAVDPLIAMAEKPAADGAVRESRIWAIVTLCNSGSPRAEEYILRRIRDPIDFGDLSFLTWHSQGFRSQKVTDALRQLALEIVTDKELPWEKTHGRESRRHGPGCLEYVFQHLISVKATVSDEVAAGALRLGDPKVAAFALQAWAPGSAQSAIATVKPLFSQRGLHPNLKKSAMARLTETLRGDPFPAYDRTTDVDAGWQAAGLWLASKGYLKGDELVRFLRSQVFCVRTPELQQQLVGELQRVVGAAFPVRSPQPVLPQDWNATWRWALKTGGLDKDEAVRFLCDQMREPDKVDDDSRRALLIALKEQLGAEFPLPSMEKVDLDNDWPTCGNWLIEKGFFGKPKKTRAKAKAQFAVPAPPEAPDAP
ncbi:MAG: hypothetical protein A3K19_05670 [Lentisphaerae bacterium RIFOXYB12_FULL_65_16]|nr:MAG: hypothetical protein A3K18_23710 [Lentisphaerae bacterium RIFOXYA12_64_32]OGV94398.1 MAG: hypothetical protein A3K19_05670 [Lentisphaerae bacterium RIFOXYB12_FULL_65_16]